MIYRMTSSSAQKVLSQLKYISVIISVLNTYINNIAVMIKNITPMHNKVLVERVRQTAWEMHYAKTDSIIYLFRLSINHCLSYPSVLYEVVKQAGTNFADRSLSPSVRPLA